MVIFPALQVCVGRKYLFNSLKHPRVQLHVSVMDQNNEGIALANSLGEQNRTKPNQTKTKTWENNPSKQTPQNKNTICGREKMPDKAL